MPEEVTVIIRGREIRVYREQSVRDLIVKCRRDPEDFFLVIDGLERHDRNGRVVLTDGQHVEARRA